jgi:hypothetical protein
MLRLISRLIRSATRRIDVDAERTPAEGHVGDHPKPFSPATGMSGFRVQAAEARTSAEVSFDPECVKTTLNDMSCNLAGGFDDALCRWR